jgi:glycosyltransferase involved in cell wall biosynthesis
MRILIVSQTYAYGNGQASFTIHLAESMAAQGHQVMVITPSEGMKSYSVYQNHVRVEKVAAVHMSILHPTMYFTPVPATRVKQLLREFQADVIHIQDHYFLCSAAVNEARRLQTPLIGTNHFLPENLLPFLRKFPTIQSLFAVPLWKMMLSVFNKLDVAITPSRTATRILQDQQIRIPVRTISNGVDTNRFYPDPQTDRLGIRRKYHLDPDRTLFLYVGRLDGEKGLDTLLEAISHLQRNDFQLAIVGRGLYRQSLEKQAQELGLQGRVVFIGFVGAEDLPALYNSADVFVMPSPEELQSIATLEAMACGKPILAANGRALPELVEPGVNGSLFQPGQPEEAAHKMNQLIEEREKWAAMGQASLERSQSHSLHNTVMHYEEQYRTAVEKIRVEPINTAMPNKVSQKSLP